MKLFIQFKRSVFFKHYLFFGLFCSVLCKHTYAQPGSLDKNFGEQGIVRTPVFNICNAVTLQKDGKIIAAGEGPVIVRYMHDGGLDSSFKQVVSQFDSLAGSSFYDIVTDKDGNIIAAGGKYYTFNSNLVVVRFHADGSIDSSFGSNGMAVADFGQREVGLAVALQADGKIVVTGTSLKYYGEDFRDSIITVRFMNDGSLDNSFAKNGRTMLGSGRQANDVVIQPDGKIVVGGFGGINDFKFLLARYLTDGSIDNSFGNRGIVLTDFGGDDNNLYSLGLQPDGKILAGGENIYASGGNMLAARYNADGSLDQQFGHEGKVLIDFGAPANSQVRKVLFQPDGKLVLAGRSYNDIILFSNYAITRINSNGSLDSSFGNNGLTSTDFGVYTGVSDAALQPDGRIVLAGNDAENYDFLLARYTGDFRTYVKYRIKKWIHNHVLHWQDMQPNGNTAYYSIERSDNASGGFSEMGRVVSSESSNVNRQSSMVNEEYSYALIEANAPHQITYYRIKAINKDGSAVYSDVITDALGTKEAALNVYPNPVKDVLNIKGFNAGMSYELSVMSAKGNLVAKTQINNTSSYSWNLQSLSKGVYYLSVTSNDKKTRVKFVKE